MSDLYFNGELEELEAVCLLMKDGYEDHYDPIITLVVSEDEVAIKMKISYDEKCGLIKIDKESYRLSKVFNIENRMVLFYFFDENSKNKTLNNLKYIKEIKVKYEFIENSSKICNWKNIKLSEIDRNKNKIYDLIEKTIEISENK